MARIMLPGTRLKCGFCKTANRYDICTEKYWISIDRTPSPGIQRGIGGWYPQIKGGNHAN